MPEPTTSPSDRYSPLVSTRTGLYCGANHVLHLERRGATEIAHRFYYEDFVALQCEQTRDDRTYTALWLVLLIGPWLVLVANFSVAGLPLYITAAITIAALFGLTANLASGPTCKMWLRTTNHTERLRGIRRYRTAQAALRELHERIADVQGDMAAAALEPEAITPFPAHQGTRPGRPKEVIPGGHELVAAAFWISIVMALSFIVDFAYNLGWKNTMDSALVFIMALLAPVALVRTYYMAVADNVRVPLAFLVGFYASMIPQMLLIVLVLALLDPASLASNAQKFEHPANMSPADGIAYYVMIGYHTLTILVMGGFGLLGLAALRGDKPSPAPAE